MGRREEDKFIEVARTGKYSISITFSFSDTGTVFVLNNVFHIGLAFTMITKH